MSRAATFTCDVCGVRCGSAPDMDHRPEGIEWVQFAMTPHHGTSVHPKKLPSVFRDMCSMKCLETMLRAAADRIAEMGK